jgi:hypothetical protein
MHNWRVLLPTDRESRPSFSLKGRWGRGEIVADDQKTLSRAFLPNGTLRPEGTYVSPSELEDIQVTLREGNYLEWQDACSKAQH